MKKYFIITVTILITVIVGLASMLNQKNKECKLLINYYDSSESLYDLLEEDTDILDTYMEGDKGAQYLDALNALRGYYWEKQGNHKQEPQYPAK